MMYDWLYRAMAGGAAEPAIPRWAAEVLSEVAQGRGGVTGVRHPLGFLCLPLERTSDQGVCVHIWSDRLANARATTSATHAHSWDLLSYVLFGNLRNELVGVADAQQGPTHRLFEVDSGGDGDEIRRTARLVRRGAATTEFLQRGDVYSLPAGVFHETVPQSEAATIALGRCRPGTVDLTLGGLDTDSHRTRRHLVGQDETAHSAALVLDRLTALPEPRQ